MMIFKVSQDLGPGHAPIIRKTLVNSRSMHSLEISNDALDSLGDIIHEALDNNMEDPTIPESDVDEIILLIEFLEKS